MPPNPPTPTEALDRTAQSLFVAGDGHFLPTRLTQGPWSPEHQFGGAPAALIAQVVESIPTPAPMQVARLTIDLLRPVPIAPIEVRSTVHREGKRIQLASIDLLAEGVEVVRATALRMRMLDLRHIPLPQEPPQPSPPEVPIRVHAGHPDSEYRPGMGEAVDYACERPDGLFEDPTWVRLRVPVVAGQRTSGLARMVYVADCVSGYGDPPGVPVKGINADISLSVVRYTDSDWLCMRGSGWVGPDGVSIAQATLSDPSGVVGTVAMSRLVDAT